MKTDRELLQDYEWFEQAEANAIHFGRDLGRTKDVSAAEALLGAFHWRSTPEGFDYWNEIHESLKAEQQ